MTRRLFYKTANYQAEDLYDLNFDTRSRKDIRLLHLKFL